MKKKLHLQPQLVGMKPMEEEEEKEEDKEE